jgi:hypothetical protein
MIPEEMNFDFNNPDLHKKGQCVACIDGYFYSNKYNRCEINPPYCERATEYSLGKDEKDHITCEQCMRGYGYNYETQKCELHKDTLLNCMESYSETKCSQCEDGYYSDLENGGCKKCSPKCASCNGPSDLECTNCSF